MLKASSVLVIAVAVATLVPVSIGLSGLGSEIRIGARQSVGIYNNNADSRIEDAKDDVTPVYQQIGTEVIPEVRDYHDILGASVQKRGEAFFFTIELAGNPNDNDKYETQYRWHIITTSPITNREQQYIIRFQNFASSGNSTLEGWYFSVFDRTVGRFIISPVSIPDMPENRVEFPIEDLYIGNPSSFSYWVDVSVRVNSTFGQPDYIMDYAP
jgi:hypothetical protein